VDISGNKVRVRDWELKDFGMEALWSLDREVILLDPPAGQVFNQERYSIEVLSGKHIGICTLYNWTHEEVQLGIRIGNRDYWSKGYGAEAVSILINYWLNTLDTPRLWLKVLPENIRAIRCYEKCGFAHVGMIELSGYNFLVMEIRR